MAPYIDLGLQFAIAIALGVAGGYWLDTKLNMKFPIFLILGLFLGATAGFLRIYRTVYPHDSTRAGKRD